MTSVLLSRGLGHPSSRRPRVSCRRRRYHQTRIGALCRTRRQSLDRTECSERDIGEASSRSTLVTRSPPEILTRDPGLHSRSDQSRHPEPPHSATSSVDGYDSFENTNNKKSEIILCILGLHTEFMFAVEQQLERLQSLDLSQFANEPEFYESEYLDGNMLEDLGFARFDGYIPEYVQEYATVTKQGVFGHTFLDASIVAHSHGVDCFMVVSVYWI